jgi:hypothetical protein
VRPPPRASLEREKVLGWPRRCGLAHAFLWEHSCKKLELAQLLGRHGVLLTKAHAGACSRAMNRFWDELEGVPGIRAHRPANHDEATAGLGRTVTLCHRSSASYQIRERIRCLSF